MNDSKDHKAAAEPPLDCRVERRCGTCKNWHKRDNYACKFNGPYGGGTDGVEGCKWKPKAQTAKADARLIAAAPMMLEALQMAFDHAEIPRQDVVRARLAIRAALGHDA